MSNIRDEYMRAKAARKKTTLIWSSGCALLIIIITGSLPGACVAATMAGIVSWWACSKRVEELGDIYHIGDR